MYLYPKAAVINYHKFERTELFLLVLKTRDPKSGRAVFLPEATIKEDSFSSSSTFWWLQVFLGFFDLRPHHFILHPYLPIAFSSVSDDEI